MKIIKDPVHGYIEVDDCILPLLDSPLLQRLRYIKQLGFSYLVYPGANHTRFEHSLGTMYLADVMCRQLDLCQDDHRLVVAAALLHDVGHGPFSHSVEPAMEEFCSRSHHDISPVLEDDVIPDILDEQGIPVDEVTDLIQGIHPLSGIIHGELDVDRMDYLLRDAHYTGAPYGTVDAHRLIRSTILADGSVVLHESGINAAESLLIARTLMRPAVYFPHVSRIAEMMFRQAVWSHVMESSPGTAEKLMKKDDAECIHELSSSVSPIAAGMADRLYKRKMYKRALYIGQEQVNASAVAANCTNEKMRLLAAAIAEYAGLEPHEVLVDIPRFPGDMSIHVQVKNQHRLLGLEEVSPLLHTLNETRRGQWRLGVYTLQEFRSRVGAAAREVIRIKPVTMQDTLQCWERT